jgi:hypothetical protein
LKIHFNIIVPSMTRSSKWSPCLGVSPPKPCMHLSCPSYVKDDQHISLFLVWSPNEEHTA